MLISNANKLPRSKRFPNKVLVIVKGKTVQTKIRAAIESDTEFGKNWHVSKRGYKYCGGNK